MAAAGLLAACNKASESGSTTPEKISASATPAPAVPDPTLPEKKVEITGNDQMKFDVMVIEAKPRQKVTVTLRNISTIPKISMGHNFVLLDKGVDALKFLEVSMTHAATDYLAPELEGQILAHTKLLGPGETDTISFAAPRTPGAYTYICSFPGHFAIGMKGLLTVQ